MQLIEYVKRRSRRVGVIVADYDNEIYNIGWSLANRKDKFDRYTGIIMAIDRSKYSHVKIPHSITKQYVAFIKRCFLYFKDKKLGHVAGV